MKKLSIIVCLCGLLSAACTEERWTGSSGKPEADAVFRLYGATYEGTTAHSRALEEVKYDRVDYYIVDADGIPVEDIKSKYDPTSASIQVEGLHAGDYRLLVLGIRGDASKDGAAVHELSRASDTWIDFPADLQRPLEAEYYYSQTPFTVKEVQTENGRTEVAAIEETVRQKRIVGRVEFDFSFRNRYVEGSVVSKTLQLGETRFYTALSGEGTYSGKSNGQTGEISLDKAEGYCFMPTVEGTSMEGEIVMLTRDYTGEKIVQHYAFGEQTIAPNVLSRVETEVHHPNDRSGLMYLTNEVYAAGGHGQILQDDEPKTVYSDANQRSFDTSQPLQIAVTDEGRLHLRFYCPRGLTNVLVKAKFAATGNEYVDLAYFDSIPPFADFYETLPLTERDAVFRTESGRQVAVARQEAASLQSAVFKVESDSECWQRLQRIKYGMGFWFDLHGTNPDAPDGGPIGNWIGIRPVHCREMVAFFLNYAYMVSMPEVEKLMEDNADKLYDDQKKPVSPQRILEQMRQYRYLSLALVYGSVSGLGSPALWSVSEGVLKGLYDHAPSLESAFHELGHVMGYNHKSAFTYGPWAMKLMNHFYLDHLKEFPIDNASYVDLAHNEHLYNK